MKIGLYLFGLRLAEISPAPRLVTGERVYPLRKRTCLPSYVPAIDYVNEHGRKDGGK